MFYAGIDAGSRTIKAVIIEGGSLRMLAGGVVDQGLRQAALASGLLARVLKKCGLGRRDLKRIVATGWGRAALPFAGTTITEITCQARGVLHGKAGAETVIDIGGQDSKLIRLDSSGNVRDFVMCDRCAAGTGRFLEVVAGRLNLDLARPARAPGRPGRHIAISSTCVVFAETEIIGLMASGARPADIMAGVRKAIAARIAAMAGCEISGPVVFTGGVALVPGMARALQSALGVSVRVARNPRLTCALGAAILAARPV
ncbi:MAG: acyl-CoA dehydratase activase [Kiritimatiellia bacterium]